MTADAVLVAGSIVVAGGAGMTWGVVNVSLRQRFIPKALYGRVQAGHRLAANVAGIAGGIVAGLVGAAVSLPAAFVIAGSTSLIACLGWIWVNDRSVATALASGRMGEGAISD
jgi:hypothetical protein